MCGIAAIISIDREIPDDSINNMIAALKHRGPDTQKAVKLNNNCHLGHTRLSIIDLSGGTQPMSDDNQRYWIVFNGEIYNYRELRQQLEKKGEHFYTKSDTEVLLKAYQVYGESILSHLNGQFAFAIWDQQEQTLFASRDRLGEKPFYYTQSPQGHLIIASEIKAILASKLIQPQLDPLAVDAYLALLYVPPKQTIYQNIHTLAPAHALIWKNGQIRQWRYWQPKYSQSPINTQDAIEQVEYLIKQAVKRQMVADVPIGAFLSGGADSSTIVALMTQYTSHPIQTFSVGFGGLINELPYAQAVAQKYQTEHNELQMDLSVGELLETMAMVYDEPFADSSNIPTYKIAEFASHKVKVVLSGDGGDELFGGYEWYKHLLMKDDSISQQWLQQIIWRILGKLHLPVQKQRQESVSRYNSAQLKQRYPDWWDQHLAVATELNCDRHALWQKNLQTKYSIQQTYCPHENLQDMDRVTSFDLDCYLSGDILVKVDRATMAHGLESRSPFLDVDLVEFVLNLPWALRFQEANRKFLLRQSCGKLWPYQLHERHKQGFGAPIWNWIKRPDVQSLLRKATDLNGPLSHLLPGLRVTVNKLSPQQQWTILCLGLWMDKRSECIKTPP